MKREQIVEIPIAEINIANPRHRDKFVFYWSCDKNLNSSVAAKSFRMWWPETGSNRRRRPFQGRLASELSGLESADMIDAISVMVSSF